MAGTGDHTAPRVEVVQERLLAISAALEDRDVAALEHIFAPQYLEALGRERGGVDAAVAELIEQQREGWLRVIPAGAETPPEVDITDSHDGAIEVRLASQAAADKSIHFLLDAHGLGFTAATAFHRAPDGIARAAAPESWRFHYKNWHSVYGMAVCTTPSVDQCGFFGPDCESIHAGGPGADWTDLTTCTPGHVLSCGIGADTSSGCLRPTSGCWYQWIGVDVWLGADAKYGCGG
jgi:hypothetical protein